MAGPQQGLSRTFLKEMGMGGVDTRGAQAVSGGREPLHR